MRVVVDPIRCEGFGPCNDVLPDVLLLDDWGYAYAIGGGEVPAGQEGLAVEATHACPMEAIQIVD